jgi:hypothetical protein
MNAILTSDERKRELAHKGYSVISLLDADEIRRVQSLHDGVFPAVPADFHSSIVSATAEQQMRVLDGLRAIVGAKLQSLLPECRIRLAAFMTKRPNSQRGRLPLHQDPWITDHREQMAPAVWCPLVDVDRASACLRVVPGSQHLFRFPCPMNALTIGARHLTYQWDADPLADDFIHDVPLRAGMAVVYDPRILHGSGENLSERTRVAFNCFMVPKDRELRVYYWDDRPPGQMETLEVTDAAFCGLRYNARPQEPYPPGVRLVETFDVPRSPMWLDRDALKRLQAGVSGAN